MVGGGASRINIRQRQETQELPGLLARCGRLWECLQDSPNGMMFQDRDGELAGLAAGDSVKRKLGMKMPAMIFSMWTCMQL